MKKRLEGCDAEYVLQDDLEHLRPRELPERYEDCQSCYKQAGGEMEPDEGH